MTIQIDFYVDPISFIGRLWDVSSSGACLLFPIREPVVPGLVGTLTIQHPIFGDPIRLRASSLWVDRLESASYVGVRFLETVDFNTTFLKVFSNYFFVALFIGFSKRLEGFSPSRLLSYPLSFRLSRGFFNFLYSVAVSAVSS
jgi:hypothetical protein